MTVKRNDSTIKISKDSLFAFEENDGTVYRFYNRKILQLLNPKEEIFLYKYERGSYESKNNPLTTRYFFSKNPHKILYTLTINNVLRCFNDNKSFCKLVELYFRYDSELILYDQQHETYKINRILALSSDN